MTPTTSCDEVRDALTDVATGVADGAARATVMAHLASCERCRAELASLAETADELLLLAPERDPSADFEGRVLARLGAARGGSLAPPTSSRAARPASVRRHRARRTLVAAAAGVALLAAGGAGIWWATAPDRQLAASYRETLDVADGRYFAAADLTTGREDEQADPASGGGSVGTVFLYDGEPSWVFVLVRDAGDVAGYDVVVTVRPGEDGDTGEAGGDRPARDIPLGTCTVAADACSVGGALDDARVHDVVSVRLVDPAGATWATADRDPDGS
ncbi:hypothetical protein GCM10009809_32010 [Isoptericola hypogeus]|uniref:Putative zinc-finger domain-containing protein n=1 Tax=Isoptericola hypogeus TaxID=300179 RepID=A0ABN2JP30_9MICO